MSQLTLPDEVLLCVFDFCMLGYKAGFRLFEKRWVRLLHVCRRWRSIVLSAPLRLDLKVILTCGMSMREAIVLDIWPTLPIAIRVGSLEHEVVENVIAALRHRDRVSRISIYSGSNNPLERVVGTMKHPFPILTHLTIESIDQTALVLPDSLVGGCAPRLQSLWLDNVAFPALPKLLLSATGLVTLCLWHLNPSEWMPPEAMVNCLSLLTRLERFRLEFKPGPHINRTTRPPHSTCLVLPNLTALFFQGMTGYFDRVFASVDAPLLKRVDIIFFDPPTFDVMRITSLLGLTETFEMPNQAFMLIAHELVDVILSPRKGTTDDNMLRLSMSFEFSDWYLTRAEYPTLPFSPHSAYESKHQRIDTTTMDGGRTHWLNLLRLFPTTENLYLFEGVASCIVFALQELAQEEVARVLPALQNLFIEHLRSSGPVEDAIGKFVAARKLSGHPVTVQCWVRGRG